jgi:hypothetical protein
VHSGSEVEAPRVSAGLIRRGHKVHVLRCGGSEMPKVRDWIDPFGVPVSILTRKAEGPRRDMIFAARLALTIWRHGNNSISATSSCRVSMSPLACRSRGSVEKQSS